MASALVLTSRPALRTSPSKKYLPAGNATRVRHEATVGPFVAAMLNTRCSPFVPRQWAAGADFSSVLICQPLSFATPCPSNWSTMGDGPKSWFVTFRQRETMRLFISRP